MSNVTTFDVAPVGSLTAGRTTGSSAGVSTSHTPLETTSARILIVDDENVNIRVVQKHLSRVGHTNFVTTTDATQALKLVRHHRPDVIISDVVMPEVSGLEILADVRRDPDLINIPVLVLTASADPETKLKALELGATDFLAKPVDPNDLIPRVRNALVVKAHHDQLADQAEELERQVKLRTAELEASRRAIICCLALAGEYRDQETGYHVVRVGRYVGLTGRELGFDEEQANLMEQAALLHDVGKIGISDSILRKPGKLSSAEFGMMKMHCQYGRRIVTPSADDRWRAMSRWVNHEGQEVEGSPILTMAARIAYTHHEQWDGNGYPRGLAGDEIPIEGRITAVADVFDALNSDRPYKRAYPTEKCFEMLEQKRGSHFDPGVLDAFMRRRDDVLQIQQEFAN